MYKTVLISFIFLLLTGCSVKNSREYKYTQKKSSESHQKQYRFDNNLHNHHNNIKNLQGEVDDLLNDMDGGGNGSSSSYKQKNQSSYYKKSNYRDSDLESMCDDVYIRYVKLLNRKADRSVISRAYKKYKKCDERKKYLQR